MADETLQQLAQLVVQGMVSAIFIWAWAQERKERQEQAKAHADAYPPYKRVYRGTHRER